MSALGAVGADWLDASGPAASFFCPAIYITTTKAPENRHNTSQLPTWRQISTVLGCRSQLEKHLGKKRLVQFDVDVQGRPKNAKVKANEPPKEGLVEPILFLRGFLVAPSPPAIMVRSEPEKPRVFRLPTHPPSFQVTPGAAYELRGKLEKGRWAMRFEPPTELEHQNDDSRPCPDSEAQA